nr:hypothetical protein BHM03_00000279 [Ipomoea batatas]
MASLISVVGFVPSGRPPSSIRVEVMKTGDCPNLFSKFFWDMRDDFSSSSYPSRPSSISSRSNNCADDFLGLVYSTYIKEDNVAVSISIMAINAIEPLRKLDIAELLPKLGGVSHAKHTQVLEAPSLPHQERLHFLDKLESFQGGLECCSQAREFHLA